MDQLSDNYFVENIAVENDAVDKPTVSPQFYEEIERHQHPSGNFPLIKVNQTRLIVSRGDAYDRIPTLYLPVGTELEDVPPNSTVCAFVPSQTSPIHELFRATDKYAELYLNN